MTSTSLSSDARTEALRAQLLELYGLRCVPLWGTPRNLDRKTYGGRVAKVSQRLGMPLMPWQRYVADVVLEVDPDTGLLAYRDVVLLVPRQSGKTSLELAVMVHRANAWDRQNILYSAQKRNAARKKWEEEHVATLERSPYVRKFRVRKANGDEAIRWANGSRHGITSNTEVSGHGETLDLGMIDEGFAHVDARMEQAFSPAMITRPQPQQWVVSTAGTAKSVFLNEKRDLGRQIVEAGEPSTVAFFDWTVLPGYDRTDPATWWACMPALGYTVTEDAVRAELTKMKDPAEFDRAYLNITRLTVVEDDPNVPASEWPDLADTDSTIVGDLALAVDVTPSRDYTSIAACGPRADGRMHVEIVDHRPGTDWVVDRVLELIKRHDPVAVALDVAGPAGSLLVELEKAGREERDRDPACGPILMKPEDPAHPKRGQLAIPTVREAAAACGALVDAARQDQLRHLDQAVLNTAIDGARTRPLGDAWAWGRKHSSSDISPLVTITLAKWACATRAHLIDNEPPPAPATANTAAAPDNDLFRPQSRLPL